MNCLRDSAARVVRYCGATIFCVALHCCVVMQLLLTWPAAAAAAPIQLLDDQQRTVILAKPACRIVSLAPHVTEWLVASGLQRCLLATLDFPLAKDSSMARSLRAVPRVGDAFGLAAERIIQMQPDLVIVWHSGIAASRLAPLQRMQLPLFFTEPKGLQGAGHTLQQLAVLMAQPALRTLAQQQQAQLQAIQRKPSSRQRIFLPIWQQPLMTVNAQHYLSEALSWCGGDNIFADLPVLSGQVSREALWQRKPDAILLLADSATELVAQQQWWRQHALPGQAPQMLSLIAPGLGRPGPEFVPAVARLCELLAKSRGAD